MRRPAPPRSPKDHRNHRRGVDGCGQRPEPGAAASQASIPHVGPALAVAAMAAMVAAVMALWVASEVRGRWSGSGPGSANVGFDPGASVRRRVRGAGGRRAPGWRGLPRFAQRFVGRPTLQKGGELAFRGGWAGTGGEKCRPRSRR